MRAHLALQESMVALECATTTAPAMSNTHGRFGGIREMSTTLGSELLCRRCLATLEVLKKIGKNILEKEEEF